MTDWIVLGCAGAAAALATYLFFGAYHYRWRQIRDEPSLPIPGCGCECCEWKPGRHAD